MTERDGRPGRQSTDGVGHCCMLLYTVQAAGCMTMEDVKSSQERSLPHELRNSATPDEH